MEQSRRCRTNKKRNIIILTVLLSAFMSACKMETGQGPWTAAENQTAGGQTAENQAAGNQAAENQAAGSQAGDSHESGSGLQSDGTAENVTAAQGETGTEATQLIKDGAGYYYYYDHLREDEKIWYEEMYAGMDSMAGEITLSSGGNATIGAEGLDKIFQCVMYDHPELFFVKGYTYTVYTYGTEISKIGFAGTYTMSKTEREEMQRQIDVVVEECLSGIDRNASDYEKVKYVYEYVIFRTGYNKEAADNQNICSVFIGKQSVCQGYAKSVQYLLNKLEIPTTLVIGTVNGTESHAWNLIQVEGEYYYLDATWGDASYKSQGEAAAVAVLPDISYDYLCVTTREMSGSHTIESPVDMPECTATAANYYVMEGAYFTAYDEGAVAALFEKSYDEDKTMVTLRCADETVYNVFLEELITNQQIFHYLNSVDGRIAYAKDPDKLSLTFWLVNE